MGRRVGRRGVRRGGRRGYAAWDTAWAAGATARALVTRDLISTEHYDTLTSCDASSAAYTPTTRR